MNENVLLSFGPILNEPWAIDVRRELLDGRYFVVSGDAMGGDFFFVYGKGGGDISWSTNLKTK